jgi:hypothetical protein
MSRNFLTCIIGGGLANQLGKREGNPSHFINMADIWRIALVALLFAGHSTFAQIALSPTFAHHGNGYMMGKSDKFFKTY